MSYCNETNLLLFNWIFPKYFDYKIISISVNAIVIFCILLQNILENHGEIECLHKNLIHLEEQLFCWIPQLWSLHTANISHYLSGEAFEMPQLYLPLALNLHERP